MKSFPLKDNDPFVYYTQVVNIKHSYKWQAKSVVNIWDLLQQSLSAWIG